MKHHLTYKAWLALTALVVMALLAACAPAATPTPTEAPPLPEATPTPPPPEATPTPPPEPTPTPTERERTLIMSYPFEPSQIDVHAYFEAEINLPMVGVYEYLYTYQGPEGVLTPQLAESYEVSEDGKTYTFKLRKGVKFHTGEDFNAEAVKWNVERQMDLNMGPARFVTQYVDSVEVVDDYTVAFHLMEPTPAYIYLLAGNWGLKFICPGMVEEHKTADDPWAHEWYKENMCGTGPYEFVSYEHGQQLVIEKFDDYWGGWEDPHFDKMIERIIPESSTQRMLLEGGEIDLTCMPLELEDIKALQEKEGITCQADPTILIFIISVKTIDAGETGPIMSNVKVRQALAHAFNYDAVIEDIMGVKGSRISDMLFNPAFEGYDPDHFVYTYDLDKAKELLAEAGYPDGGFTLDMMWLEGFPDYPRIGEMYQADLAKLGITLTLHGEPPATFLDRIALPETTPDLVLRPRAATNPHSFAWIQGWIKEMWPPAALNEGYYYNPEFEELYKASTTELDDAKRAGLVREAAAIASEEVPVIWIAAVNDVMCFTDSLKGQVHSPWYMYVYWPYNLYRE